MRWIESVGQLLRRLRFFVLRDRYTADLEEEIRLHVDLRAERLRDTGLSAGAARYAARRRFGNPVSVQERSRDTWGLRMLEEAFADLRFAVRRLRRRPAFAVSVIAVVALGISATTAVFSAFDAVLLRPLPFARPSELYTLTDVNLPSESEMDDSRSFIAIGDVSAMKDLFSHTAAYAAGGLNFADPVSPQRVRVGVVTPDFFPTLGAAPQAGRAFDDADGRPHGSHSVVLSDAFWTARFGRADVIGRSIDLSGVRYVVVGVMRSGFNFPNESDLWIPLTVPTTDDVFRPFRGYLPSSVIARTAPGISAEAVSARLLDAWRRIRPSEPSAFGRPDYIMEELRTRGAAVPLRKSLIGNTQRPFVILMGAAALLLLIACANVASLLVSDAAGRRREMALREVLGASGTRVTRQLLAESLLLAGVGAALGVAMALPLMRVLGAMLPSNLAGVSFAQLDLRILLFAAAITFATGLAFGLWPAVGLSRADASHAIKSGGGLGATAGGLGLTRRALLSAEIVLTVMLLVGSGLMLRSLHRLMSQPLGMNPEHVGSLELSFPSGLARGERLRRIHEIARQMALDPGLQSVAVVNDLPLRGAGGIALSIVVDGVPRPKAPDETAYSRYLIASGDYFRTLGIPFVRGRTFTSADDSLAPRVAIINAAMAKRWWPERDAIGQTFRIGPDTAHITVVGVVADVREGRLESPVQPQLYLPLDARPPDNVAIVVRGTLEPGELLARMRRGVRAADPTQAIYNLRTMDDVIARSVSPRQTNTTLITVFTAAALLLSAFGVYAVMSHSVASRGRELGIRAALGATSRDIVTLVGREMVVLVATSLIVGLMAAWGLARILSALLFDVQPHDVGAFVAAPIVLAVAAALATLVPVRRAVQASPTEVMRVE